MNTWAWGTAPRARLRFFGQGASCPAFLSARRGRNGCLWTEWVSLGRPFMWQRPQDSADSSPFDSDEGPCGLSGDRAQSQALGSPWAHTAMPKVVRLEVRVELTRARPELPESPEGPWVPLVRCTWHLPETVEDITNSLPMPTVHLPHPPVSLT